MLIIPPAAVQRVQCCEVCGVVAHDGTCVRKAAHDCRPVTEASESMVHLWQPAGTIYYDSEVSQQILLFDIFSTMAERLHNSLQRALTLSCKIEPDMHKSRTH